MTGWRTVKDPPAGPLGASLPAAPAALSVGALQPASIPSAGLMTTFSGSFPPGSGRPALLSANYSCVYTV